MKRRHDPDRDERASVLVEVLRRATKDPGVIRSTDQGRTERVSGQGDPHRRAMLSPLRHTPQVSAPERRRSGGRAGPDHSVETLFFA